VFDNIEKVLAKSFNKENGIFLYSGTLAIEYALGVIEGIRGQYVILPNNVCYNVLLSVLRVGAIPVLVKPKNQLILTVEDVLEVKKEIDVKVVIAVHHLGIPVDVQKIRKRFLDIIIIEDSSQFFYSDDEINNIGKFSDFVVTSFGSTKPLSFGIGGGLFSNNDLLEYANSDSVSSRYKTTVVYPYLLPKSINIDANELMHNAKITIQRQRKFAEFLQGRLEKLPLEYWKTKNEEGCGISWSRFPIWSDSIPFYQLIINTATKYNIRYQLPHKDNLECLPILKDHKYLFYDLSVESIYFMLIRTIGNNEKEVSLWTDHLLDILTKI
jgi:dTDP-4-amino-4,6-dideoxygalactose transaminase